MLMLTPLAGCNDQKEAAMEETTPATTTPASPGAANSGLASAKRDLKIKADAGAQSTESPVGAGKENTP